MHTSPKSVKRVVVKAGQSAEPAAFSLLTYPGKSFSEAPMRARITAADIKVFDETNMPIPLCTQEELDLAVTVHQNALRLRDVAEISRGEINQTIFREFISSDSTLQPLLKGVEVRMFGFNEKLSQGEREYFNETLFEKRKRAKRPAKTRIATQRITGVDEKRRIVAALSPNHCEVEIDVRQVKDAPKVPSLDDVYEILGRRHTSGEHDLAERHNEHQP